MFPSSFLDPYSATSKSVQFMFPVRPPASQFPFSKQKDPAGHGRGRRVCPMQHIESHHFLSSRQMLPPQTVHNKTKREFPSDAFLPTEQPAYAPHA